MGAPSSSQLCIAYVSGSYRGGAVQFTQRSPAALIRSAMYDFAVPPRGQGSDSPRRLARLAELAENAFYALT